VPALTECQRDPGNQRADKEQEEHDLHGVSPSSVQSPPPPPPPPPSCLRSVPGHFTSPDPSLQSRYYAAFFCLFIKALIAIITTLIST
jgi:hypothetical protein